MNRFFSSRQKHSSLPRGQGREITSHSVDASVIQFDFQAYRFLREFLQSAATFPARRPEQLVSLEGIAVGETVAFKRLPLYIGHLYSNFVSGLHIETDLAAAPQKGNGSQHAWTGVGLQVEEPVETKSVHQDGALVFPLTRSDDSLSSNMIMDVIAVLQT